MSGIEAGLNFEPISKSSALLVPILNGSINVPVIHLPTDWGLSSDECPYIPRNEDISHITRSVLPHNPEIDRPGNHREKIEGVEVRKTPVILNPVISNEEGRIDAYSISHPVFGRFHLKLYGQKFFRDGQHSAIFVDGSGLRGYEGLGIDNPYGTRPDERIIFAQLENFHNSSRKVWRSCFADIVPAHL